MYYDVKEKIVKSGGSKVFHNWSTQGITEEEFLAGLKWLCEDKRENGKLSRELGCHKNELVRLERHYHSDGSFAGFYECESKKLYAGYVSISADDRI